MLTRYSLSAGRRQPLVGTAGLISLALWLVASLGYAQAPAGQSFIELSVDDSLKGRGSDVRRILRDGNYSAVSGGEQLVADYYTRYALPRWTLEENLGKLAEFRRELIGSELGSAREGGQPHDDAVQLVMQRLEGFVTNDQIHPAVRFNAALAIGELNAQEKPVGAGQPQPLPAAAPFLLAQLQDANQIDAVRVAALIGLERHAALGIGDADFRDSQLVPAMVQLANGNGSNPGTDPEVHAWMRSRAIDILGAMGSPGSDGSIAAALTNMSANKNEHPRVRCAACMALGQLQIQGNEAVDASAAARGVGKAVYDLFSGELQRAQSGSEKLSPQQLAGYLGAGKRGIDGIGNNVAGVAEVETLTASIRSVFNEIGREIDNATAEPERERRRGPEGYPGYPGSTPGSEAYGSPSPSGSPYPGYPSARRAQPDPTEQLIRSLPPLLARLQTLIRPPAAAEGETEPAEDAAS